MKRLGTLLLLVAISIVAGAITYQIERPLDLPLATTIHDTDVLVIDQGAAGLKHVPVSFLRSMFAGSQFSSNLTGDTAPTLPAPVGTMYLRVTSTNREVWVNTSGTNWETWISSGSDGLLIIDPTDY